MKHIDITPTWTATANIFAATIMHGTDKGKLLVIEEIRKICKHLDEQLAKPEPQPKPEAKTQYTAVISVLLTPPTDFTPEEEADMILRELLDSGYEAVLEDVFEHDANDAMNTPPQENKQ